jgi:hypothetical protein
MLTKKELKNTSMFSLITGIVGGCFGQPHFRKSDGKPSITLENVGKTNQ